MPILTIEKGPDKGRSLKFQNSITIGRDTGCEIKIVDTAVSRKHCKIYYDTQYFLEDLDSLNGTQLNGQFITAPTILKDNDQINIGETGLLWQEKEQTDALINKVIAGYKVTQRLGKGGMGTVYLARQLSLDRDVALKILDPKVAQDHTFIQRFIYEARSCATLNHPNIIQVYDVGEDQGYFYFSMEYAKGGSLQSLIAGGKSLPWQEALSFMYDTALGLEYAEKKKIVHRDIKPDNLMLTEEKHIKIVDLGLARRFDESPAIPENSVYGTPLYVSPEQAKGLAVDFRADIYSFGASFYRILSGHAPFQGKSVPLIIAQHIKDPPVPLKNILPDIPIQLSDMIDKMMQKKPEDRYASNSLVLQEIRKLQELLNRTNTLIPTRARRNPNRSTMSVNRKELKRRKENQNQLWTIMASVIAFALIVLIISIFASSSTPPVETLLDTQIQESYQSLYSDYQIQGDTESMASAWEKFYQKNKDNSFGKKAYEHLKQIQQNLSLKREQNAQNLYQNAQKYEKEYPENLSEIIEKYQDIVDRFSQTSTARLAKNDIDRIQNLVSEHKQKLLQDFRQIMEKFGIAIEQENFAKAANILNTFQKECQNDVDILQQISIRKQTLIQKKIPEFVEKTVAEIKESIQEKNLEQTKLLVKKLEINREFPIVENKLKEFEKYLSIKPNNQNPENSTPVKIVNDTSKSLFIIPDKIKKMIEEFQFLAAIQELKSSTIENKKTLLDDMIYLEKFFKKINERLKKNNLAMENSTWIEILPHLGNIEPYSISLYGIENSKISVKATVSEGAIISKNIFLKNFSSEWIYSSILFSSQEKDKDSIIAKVLFCYYYELYQHAWYWNEQLGKIDALKSQEFQNRLQIIEDNAKKEYIDNIVPLYQQNMQYKEDLKKETKSSPEYLALKQKLQQNTQQLQSQVQEYTKKYQNTRFYNQIRD